MATGTQYRANFGITRLAGAYRQHRDNPVGGKNNDNWRHGGMFDPFPFEYQRGSTPRGVYAAYESIWKQITLDPAASGTTYPQTCYATATGTASFARVATFPRQLTVSGSGATTLGRQIGKTFATTGTGAASAIKKVAKTLSTTGSGTASLTATLITSVIQQCYATGNAAVSLSKKVVKTLAASGIGTATVTKTVGKQLYATGAGAASVVKTIKKTLTFTGTGAATVLRKISKTFSTTGTGAASLADSYVATKQVSTTGTGTVSSTQTFQAGGPPAIVAALRRVMFNYLRRR